MAAFSANAQSVPMAEINVTPLVDVMLVLLIIFMVTMPIQTYNMDVGLPQAGPATPPPSEQIELSIDSIGQMRLNGMVIEMPALEVTMREAIARNPTNAPALRIETARDTPYGAFARVLAAAKNADMQRIGVMQD